MGSRLPPVSAGSVRLDGVDLRSLNLRWLRQQMGLVSQEPALFGTTLRENLLYGREGASDADVEARCCPFPFLCFLVPVLVAPCAPRSRFDGLRHSRTTLSLSPPAPVHPS